MHVSHVDSRHLLISRSLWFSLFLLQNHKFSYTTTSSSYADLSEVSPQTSHNNGCCHSTNSRFPGLSTSLPSAFSPRITAISTNWLKLLWEAWTLVSVVQRLKGFFDLVGERTTFTSTQIRLFSSAFFCSHTLCWEGEFR